MLSFKTITKEVSSVVFVIKAGNEKQSRPKASKQGFSGDLNQCRGPPHPGAPEIHSCWRSERSAPTTRNISRPVPE